MPVDLQKVQDASNIAHRNFLEAIELDKDQYRGPLLAYIDSFLKEPVERPSKVKACAENAKSKISRFNSSYLVIVENIGLTRLEMDMLVTSAQVKATERALKGFNNELLISHGYT